MIKLLVGWNPLRALAQFIIKTLEVRLSLKRGITVNFLRRHLPKKMLSIEIFMMLRLMVEYA